MITTSHLKPGIPQVEYYAPRLRVISGGRVLSSEVMGDVLQVKVTMKKNAMTTFNLSLSNWEDNISGSPRFKYSDSNTFDIGTELRIELGYADELIALVNAQVNSLSPKFPESGTPTIDVSGTNAIFRLKGSKPQKEDQLSFVDKTDWQIAQLIAARNRLPIQVTREGPIHDQVVQKRDQDDASFLLDRAKRIEFDVFMQPDRNGRDTLYFVKPQDGRDASPIMVFDFKWGENLIEFSPKQSASDQVSSVTVKGWDPKTKTPIEYTATDRDLPITGGSGKSGPSTAKAISPRGKADVIVDASVLSEEEARRLAVSRLARRAYQYKTGSGRVIGQPKMRPGDNVNLSGLGKRFSGMWHITQVDHSFGGSGFTTSFQVERLRENA